MNYKPDENVLISYIYGELDGDEKAKLEQYFREHPEVRAKMTDLAAAREMMGFLKDKEVIVPPLLMEDHSGIRSIWSTGWFRALSGIAASFLLLMVAGRIIGMDIRYREGELRITFGGASMEIQQRAAGNTELAGLSSGQVQSMINSSLLKNNELISSQWTDQQKQLDLAIRQSLDHNSRKIDGVMKEASLASQKQVRNFVSGMQSENLRLMKDYLQLSSAEQKKYVENLLVDFSKYLQEQRSQDINLFQARINSVEKNSEQFKQDTEQILGGIISRASVTTKKNSY